MLEEEQRLSFSVIRSLLYIISKLPPFIKVLQNQGVYKCNTPRSCGTVYYLNAKFDAHG